MSTRITSVRFKLTLIFLLVIPATLAGFGVISYQRIDRQLESQRDTQIQSALSRLALNLPNALWNFDKPQIDSVLRSEMGSSSIVGLSVVKDGAVQAGVQRTASGEIVDSASLPEASGKRSIDLFFVEGEQKSPLGQLTLSWSDAEIRTLLREEIFWQVAKTLFMAAMLLGTLWFSLRSIVFRPLGQVRRALQDIGSGEANLARRLPPGSSTDFVVVTEGFNRFVERIESVVVAVRDKAGSVADGSREIARANQDFSTRTEEQARELQSTASEMQELNASVAQNARNGSTANELAINARSVAVNGSQVMKSVVETMSGINESSQKIGEITNVIDGIAFQTNILALNAAVEAARAGEQGRGFAVVAAEVRSLAHRSADAAKQIKTLIANSSERVGAGQMRVNEAGRTMDEIVASTGKVCDIMSEISAASRAQSVRIESMTESLSRMEEVTQRNAAQVEEGSAASTVLSDAADGLVGIMQTFKTTTEASA